jgi:hypothetical protein
MLGDTPTLVQGRAMCADFGDKFDSAVHRKCQPEVVSCSPLRHLTLILYGMLAIYSASKTDNRKNPTHMSL